MENYINTPSCTPIPRLSLGTICLVSSPHYLISSHIKAELVTECFPRNLSPPHSPALTIYLPFVPLSLTTDTKLTHLMYNYFGQPWHPQGGQDNFAENF